MSKNIDLKRDSIKKIFMSYLLPAIAGMVVKSLYITTDSIFVGRGVGAIGLAGVNLIIPLFSILIAIAMMFGIGGATVVSIEFGKGNNERASQVFTGNIIGLTVIMILVTVVGLINIDKIVYLLGATENIFPYTKAYLSILLKFTIVYGLGQGLSSFVRNDGNPKLAMYSLVFSALFNCVLDYIFIFKFNWGIEGAALATGISQVVACIVLLTHFVSKKSKLKFMMKVKDTQLIRSIRNGLPTFFTEMSVGVTTLAFNIVIIKLLGEKGITSYSIVMSLSPIFIMTFAGISQAIQPIISFNYGANERDRVTEALNLGIRTSLSAGIIFFIVALIFGESMIKLFNNKDMELISYTVVILRKYFSAFILMGVNIVVTTYFQAIEKSNLSTIISILRGFVFVLICLFVIPHIGGNEAIWYSVTIAEILTIIICAYQVRKEITSLKKFNIQKIKYESA